jgi:hypothetical protein
MRLPAFALTALLIALLFVPAAAADTLVFARGSDDALWMHAGTWSTLGGRLASAPDAASWGPNRVDVFARGADDHLWQISRLDGRWTDWTDLGGTLRGGPGAVSWGPNRIDVAAVGSDQAMWHRAWDGSRWTEWTSLGGRFAAGSSPDLASRGPNQLDLFARGEDGALWTLAYEGGSWGEWTSLGGNISSDPGAVSWGPGRLDVFARGGEEQMWQVAWDGSQWSDWVAHGGRFTSGFDATSSGANRVAAYGRGTDNALWQREWNGTQWTDWKSLGGTITSDPSAITIAGQSRARFRVTLVGFSVNRESWDDILERDGKRDEVFIVHEARVLDAGASVVAATEPVRSRVMGDVNRHDWRTTRIAAGTASAEGGIKTGNEVITDLVLWEGELASGANSVVIVPTIWEWDGDPDFLNRALGFLGAPIVLLGEGAGIALSPPSPDALPATARALLGHVFARLTARGEIGANVRVSKNVFGDPKDRPIGMKDAGVFYVFEPQALRLDFNSASLLSRTNFGAGNGILGMTYRDAEELKGDYTLHIHVERKED